MEPTRCSSAQQQQQQQQQQYQEPRRHPHRHHHHYYHCRTTSATSTATTRATFLLLLLLLLLTTTQLLLQKQHHSIFHLLVFPTRSSPTSTAGFVSSSSSSSSWSSSVLVSAFPSLKKSTIIINDDISKTRGFITKSRKNTSTFRHKKKKKKKFIMTSKTTTTTTTNDVEGGLLLSSEEEEEIENNHNDKDSSNNNNNNKVLFRGGGNNSNSSKSNGVVNVVVPSTDHHGPRFVGDNNGIIEDDSIEIEMKRRKRIESIRFYRMLLAEGIGTGIIVLLGTGAVMSAVYTNALVGLFQIAAVWIIAVTLAIATTANISGAHLNPAITIAFAILRRRPHQTAFPWTRVWPYCVAQTMGAVIASWFNLLMYASSIREYESVHNIIRSGPAPQAIASAKGFGEYYLPPVTMAQAFWVEALGTAVLAFVIFTLTHPANDTQRYKVYIPPFIGMTVGGLISIMAPLTQAGFNPARDFGPRIVAYAAGWTNVAFKDCWLYIVAPIIGAPIGGFVADYLLFGGELEYQQQQQQQQ